jgi:hypothetical protein
MRPSAKAALLSLAVACMVSVSAAAEVTTKKPA